MTNIDFELASDRQATLRREAELDRLGRRTRQRTGRQLGAGRSAGSRQTA